MIDVDKRSAMNPFKARSGEFLLDGPKPFRRKVSLLGSHDPDEFAIRLKRQHLGRIQQEVLIAEPSDHLPRTRHPEGRCRLLNAGYRFCGNSRLLNQLPGAFQRFLQAGFTNRLQEIVDGAGVQRFDRVLVERSHDNDHRDVGSKGHVLDDFEAAHTGHLQVEKNDIRMQRRDAFQRRRASGRFANHLDVFVQVEFIAQDLPCNRFVVDDERSQHVTKAVEPAAPRAPQ